MKYTRKHHYSQSDGEYSVNDSYCIELPIVVVQQGSYIILIMRQTVDFNHK
jgi:hypothetical protein